MNIREYTVYETIKLLDYYIFITNSKNILYVSKNENNIIIFNNNIKTVLTKNTFLEKFSDCTFFIYKELYNDVEIDTEYRKIRQ